MAKEQSVVSEACPEKPGVGTASDDKALEFWAQHHATGSLSPGENKKVLKKIDTRLVPMVSFGTFCEDNETAF